MPSDVDDLFAELGWPNLQAAQGESVVQWPLGVSANAVTLTGVLVNLATEGELPIDTEHGSQVVRYGTLVIDASVTVTDDERKQQRDIFVVRGKVWDTDRIVGQTLAATTVRIKRTESVSTKRTRV